MAARVALLQMEKDGLIKLPPVVESARISRLLSHPKPILSGDLPPLESVHGAIKDLRLEFSIVGKSESKLWNAYIDRYHYLGYKKLGGAQLRYIVRSNGKLVAFFGFSAAAWKVKSRDEFIGWTREQKERNLHLVINNSRFLILPSVETPHLASHLLGKVARQLPVDWHRTYNYKPVLMETFVQKDKFKGTCYRAANWRYLGDTKGRGKFDITHKNPLPVKSLWIYPLTNNLASLLHA